MFRSIHDRDRQRPRPPFERQSELLLDRRGQRNGKRVGAVHVEPRWRPPARGLEFNQGVEEPVEPGPVDHRCLELAGKPADEFRDPEHWIEWSWSHGARQLWEMVGDDVRPTAHAAAIDALSSLAEPDGSLVHQWRVRYTIARR